MKKLLLIPAMLMAFTAFAQDEETENPGSERNPWSIDIIRQNPDELTVTKPLESSNFKTSAGYDIYTIDVEIETFPGQGDSKYFLNLYYTQEDGSQITTKLGTSTNGTAISRGANEAPLHITVSAWYNTKDNKVEYIDSYFNLLMFDVVSDWTGRGYWPSNTDNTDLSAYFIYDSSDNNGSGTTYMRRAVNSNASTANYYCGSQNETRFKIPNLKGYASGLYKATLDYYGLTLSVEPAESMEIFIQKYATFYAPTEVLLPEGVKAYALTFGDNKVKRVELENVIPANTPVLLEATDVTKENSYITLNVTDFSNCEYSAINATKRYIADFIDENNSYFVGVNQTHYVPADVDAYVLNGVTGNFELKSSKVNGTGLAANTTIVIPAFSMYVKLASEKWEDDIDLSILEVVDAAEDQPEDMFYVHFTDEDGNYTSTFVNEYFGVGPKSCLTPKDGSYYLEWIEFTESPTYFVLSKYPYPATIEGDDENENEENEISLMAYDSTSWSNFNGTIYHDGGEIDPTKVEAIKPYSKEAGTYQITFNPNDDTEEAPTVTLDVPVATGIGEVEINKAENEVMYNIFGMPVDKNYKGIVIKNGKKLILR